MGSPHERKLRRLALGFCVLTFLCAIVARAGWMTRLEEATLDFRYAHFNRATRASDRVVVIDIDEASVKSLAPTLGRWPWPRRIHKDLVEFLSVGQPAAILFDILFTEAMPGGRDDEMLARASAASGVVSHAMTLLKDRTQEGTGDEALPDEFARKFSLSAETPESLRPLALRAFHDFEIPPARFYRAVPKMHVVTVDVDPDGVYRRVPVIFQYGKSWFPSLPLQGLLASFRDPRIVVHPHEVVLLDETATSLRVPVEPDGMLRVHYYRDDRAPAVYPIAAALSSARKLQSGEVADARELPLNPLELKDKIVLVGGSATGLQDLKATPIHPAYPGVLLQATAISNALTGDFLRPAWAIVWLAAPIAITLAAYCALFLATGLVAKIGLALLVLVAYDALAITLFQHMSVWLPMALPSAAGLIALFDGLAYLVFAEGRDKRKLKETLSKYVAPAIAEKLIASGIDPQAEVGNHKELTILFADIRGFTSFSEAFPPQRIVECLNEYFDEMGEVVFASWGTLDKFMGDGLMAFWGAPLDDDLHAAHAVRCALAMLARAELVRAKWTERLRLPSDLRIGIGINTGQAIVGNIGSARHLSYTAIGDNVNLASRIEGLTSRYRAPLLVGEGTYERIKQSFVCRVIDDVRVKGRTAHVKIYEALVEKTDPGAPRAEELASAFERAWTAYRAGDFRAALKLFENVSRLSQQDGPTAVYVERCQQLISTPPTEWSGVHVLDAK